MHAFHEIDAVLTGHRETILYLYILDVPKFFQAKRGPLQGEEQDLVRDDCCSVSWSTRPFVDLAASTGTKHPKKVVIVMLKIGSCRLTY